LQRLWRNIHDVLSNYTDSLNQSTVCFLGDYCDRGSDTAGTIDYLVSLSRLSKINIKYLMGNHDHALAMFLNPSMEDFSKTCIGYNPRHKTESLYTGDGSNRMHLQGRRYAATTLLANGLYLEDSIYSSKRTFDSYHTPYADHRKLLDNIPKDHLQFFTRLDWIHEEYTPQFGRIIAVHAGLEDPSTTLQPTPHLLIDNQIKKLVNKVNSAWIEPICGRDNVRLIPQSLLEQGDTWVISGHFGFFEVSGRRLIIDECGGLDDRELSCVVMASCRDIIDPPINLSHVSNNVAHNLASPDSHVQLIRINSA
jgi:hypothetical protein